jgi:hypothetical protein
MGACSQARKKSRCAGQRKIGRAERHLKDLTTVLLCTVFNPYHDPRFLRVDGSEDEVTTIGTGLHGWSVRISDEHCAAMRRA